MKRRVRRAMIGATVLVAGVVGVLVATHWGAVRDHVEAWHFQLTRETRTLQPLAATEEQDRFFGRELISFQTLSTHSGSMVICDPNVDHFGFWQVPSKVTVDEILRVLRENGYRVLEQRFPRSAYVVMREKR